MISLVQMKSVLADFLDKQVVPNINSSLLKWTITGSSALYLNNLENVLAPYKETLLNLGLADGELKFNTPYVKTFLENAFKAEPTLQINILGSTITFRKEDADVLIKLMEDKDGREELAGSGDSGDQSTSTEKTGTVEQPTV